MSSLQKSDLFEVNASSGEHAAHAVQIQQAIALHQQGEFDQASAIYETILSSDPHNFDALQLSAALAGQNDEPERAIALFDQALQINSKHPSCHNNRGNALFALQRYVEALESYDRVLQLMPDDVMAHYNRGNVLSKLKQFAPALDAYAQALKLKPDYGEVYLNRGNTLRDLHQFKEALADYAQALQIQPDYADVHMNEGMCRLLAGDLARGWEKYEWRFKANPGHYPLLDFDCPRWLGQENIANRTILLHGEQGYGDMIQFCRYAKQVAALGATVILLVPAALKSVLRELDGVARLVTAGDVRPHLDYHCHLLSLPLVFRTDLRTISNLPYLRTESEKSAQWQAQLAPGKRKKIGLVWSGNVIHGGDAERSIPLALFGTLCQEQADFYCLQQELRAADYLALGQSSIRFFGAELLDFSDTAALIGLMDLVITVDTSVAHLAGALGKPVWILLPFNPDWRWMLEREDSPWYGSARLFRQPCQADWSSVMLQVKRALRQFILPPAPPLVIGHGLTTSVDELKLECGFALHQQGQLDQAEVLYREVLESQAQHADALQLLATVILQRDDFDAALALFDRVIALNPNLPDVHYNRGNALRSLKQWLPALAAYQQVLELDPEHARAHLCRGSVLKDLKRWPEALASYALALQFQPDCADAYNQRGFIQHETHQFRAALESFRLAQQIRPDHADFQLNESLCRLLLGEFALGWDKYESRWEASGRGMRGGNRTLWLGQESLQGKTILLYGEQGLGDTIQFCRYIKQVAALGAQVFLGVPACLTTLLAQLEGIARFLDPLQAMPEIDYHCPLMSLGLVFNVHLANISNAPYLHYAPQKYAAWRLKLAPGTRLKVGIAWCGGALSPNEAQRSVPLATWQSILQDDMDFYCLQPELPVADYTRLTQIPAIHFFGSALQDFDDTAALIGLMDLVITVDTSVAHLAGAMGKTVWLLLQFTPDWRWLLEREDSPWYGSVRLFRQTRAGDWDSVLAQVISALKQFDPSPRQLAPAVATPIETAQLDRALALHEQGQWDAAAVSYQEILDQEPNNFNALQLFGALTLQRQDFAAALNLFDRIVALNPAPADVHYNRACALRGLQQWQPALDAYQQSLQRRPDYPQAHCDCAQALFELQRWPEAVLYYEQALQLESERADLYYCKGLALQKLQHWPDALASFELALQRAPEHVAALLQRGNVLHSLKQFNAALASYEQALQLEPALAELHHNRGLVLYDLNLLTPSLASFDRAVQLKPAYVDALNNRGNTLCQLQRYGDAIESYRQALQFMPEHVGIRFNDGLCRLLLGDFGLGWQHYELRWKDPIRLHNTAAIPTWLGWQSLHNKTIVLYFEQGFGDTIQFCRYVSQVVGLGATVILEVQAALAPLMRQLGGVTRILTPNEAWPEVDYQCSLMSLPLAFQTDLAALSQRPYLLSEPQKRAHWEAQLPRNDRKRVGLAWSGSVGHVNDMRRSMLLKEIAVLFDHTALDFYCLQTELRAPDQAYLAQTPQMQFFGPALHDFSDTAALISLMDVVLTVDTCIAHLAGALGKPVWVLLSFAPDWRWLLERNDSPWYGSARLFRQARVGDWAGVLEQVALALQQLDAPSAPPQLSNAGLASMHSAQLEVAFALQQEGRNDQAQAIYKDILQSEPEHLNALQLLAASLAEGQDLAAAVSLFDQVIGLYPGHACLYFNRGQALTRMRHWSRALESFEQALQYDPGSAETHNRRGQVLLELKRLPEALISYEQAIRLEPDAAAAYHHVGLALAELKQWPQALASFEQALRCDPQHADVYNDRGIVLYELKRWPEALAEYEQALRLRPEHIHAYNNRGTVLFKLNRVSAAFDSYERALALNPADVNTQNNMGLMLMALNQPVQALETFERIALLEPTYAEAQFNASLCQLLMADFVHAWPRYEWRWKMESNLGALRTFPSALLWLGQAELTGRTILLHSEQGLGDTIQFCRYAKEVAAMGATVFLEVPAPLVTLLRQLDGVTRVLASGDALPAIDFHCPMMSLPFACSSTSSSVSARPYLYSDAQKQSAWQATLHATHQIKVGLAWRGSAHHRHDAQRSIALDDFALLLQQPIDFYALHMALDATEQAVWARTPQLHCFNDAFVDFSDTAALIALMDLVITVDTSVAHLAGAMGKPVWILLPFSPDWRWQQERSDSPWYGSARLFRQTARGDWTSVLEQVALALQQFNAAMPLLPSPAAEDSGAIGLKLDAAFALQQAGQLDQADLLYQEILQAEPRHFDALHMRAVILGQGESNLACISLFEQAIALDPQCATLHNNFGNALRQLKRLTPALESYDRALQLMPDYLLAHGNRGHVLYDLDRMPEAVASYEHMFVLEPDCIEAHNHLGTAWLKLKQFEPALRSYERALQLKPDYAKAWSNRGAVLLDLKRLPEACDSYEQALRYAPELLEARFNGAICYLSMGNFAAGWRQYETRWDAVKSLGGRKNFAPAVLWLGAASLQNKTILLHSEQGFGDTFQFCRYAAQVARLGATVILLVQPGLSTALIDIDGVARVIAENEALPECDFHCPLMSLPLAFQTDFSSIDPQPYLQSDPRKAAQWQAHVDGKGKPNGTPNGKPNGTPNGKPNGKPKVGLVWSGSAVHLNDAQRSISLDDWATILNDEADFYCLKAELSEVDQASLAQLPQLHSFIGTIRDFSDTAALIALMDVVITVDTSVAHLAGAMGKPVWILLPFVSDWRWLAERLDSPWYGSARLFRQPRRGDWASVLEQVASALLQLTSSKSLAPALAFKAGPTNSQKLEAALVLLQTGQLDQAEVLYRDILQSQPGRFDALHMLGMIAAQRQDFVGAVTWLEQAVRLHPHHAGLQNNFGNVLYSLQRLAPALERYDRALLLCPDYPDARANRALVLHQLKRLPEAVAELEQALLLKPDAKLHDMRGTLFGELGRWPEALASFDQAVLLQPEFAEAHNHRGAARFKLEQREQALASYDRALELRPDYGDAWYSRGCILAELKQLPAALASYAQALRIDPGLASAHLNDGLCRLLMGDFALGWQQYEWRWDAADGFGARRQCGTALLWLGQATLQHKTILLHSEQGFGDTIQFFRYAIEVAGLGAHVTLAVPASLRVLLDGFDGVTVMQEDDSTMPEFDYHCPMMSLPLAFQADLSSISDLPYLHADPQKMRVWQAQLASSAQPKIGLVWRGNAGHANDAQRSIRLAHWDPILHQSADFYSLQSELSDADQVALAQLPQIHSLLGALHDFSETAALIALMDVVITVDTSVAHLAGAMGKPVWILLPFKPDWRWLLERDDSPWYGSAKLFRQTRRGDWSSVMAQVATELRQYQSALRSARNVVYE